MSFQNIAAGLGGLIGGGVNVYNAIQSANLLKYQKEVQGTTWAREDNAVQRRVADLKAAGINPVLAAGSAAQTSSPISVTAPRAEFTAVDNANTVLSALRQKLDMSRTSAETELLKKQQEGVDLANRKTALETAIRSRDFDLIRRDGVRSDQKSWASEAKDVMRMFVELYNQTRSKGSLLDALGVAPGAGSPPTSTGPLAPKGSPSAVHDGPAGKSYYWKAEPQPKYASDSGRAHE